MLIQKTFHLRMRQDVAKACLADFDTYSRKFVGVDRAALTANSGVHLKFRLPCGYRVEVALGKVPGVNPAQTLFRSFAGNVEALGVLEYFQIKPSLTEIVLTLDYTIASPIFSLLDYMSNSVDKFVNRQLAQIEAYFEPHSISGIPANRNLPAPINGHKIHQQEH